MARFRAKHIAPRGKLAVMLEPVVLGTVFVAVMVLLPVMWQCKPVPHSINNASGKNETWAGLELYICDKGDGGASGDAEGGEYYNEMASLVFGTGEDTVRQLLSRNANQAFGYFSMILYLVLCVGCPLHYIHLPSLSLSLSLSFDE